MVWALPEFTKGQVDAAGQILARPDAPPEDLMAALEVVSNWRAVHAFPLNTFQIGLRSRARAIYANALVAQRLKRLSSIEAKLRRFPSMNLARMQDIGGCRAVLRSPAHVRRLREDYKSSRIKHQLVGEKDYIENPKSSGYRGVHLVYRYQSDKMDTYNGLLVEIQIRSRAQHAWATAVETVGTFLEHSLKSSLGPEQWLRFFAVASSALALVEKAPAVPQTPSSRRILVRETKALMRELGVYKKLKAFGDALHVTEDAGSQDAHYFLLSLVPGQLRIRSYRVDELPRATEEYMALERQYEGKEDAQAVLVAAESLKSLRRAYPNYYLDTQVFLMELSRALTE
jgi:hypothetical protein